MEGECCAKDTQLANKDATIQKLQDVLEQFQIGYRKPVHFSHVSRTRIGSAIQTKGFGSSAGAGKRLTK